MTAGIITARGPPKLGMNCNTPASTAQSGAQGMPMISNPASHNRATAAESRHWATNQSLRAVPVVRASSRQPILLVNHKGHEGTRRENKQAEICGPLIFVVLRVLCG